LGGGDKRFGSRFYIEVRPSVVQMPECLASLHFIQGGAAGRLHPGDAACANGMHAAGLEGPYYRTTETGTYSWPCLVTLGLFGKVGGVKAGNYAAGKAAGWAEGAVASESALMRGAGTAIGTAARVYASPYVTAMAAPYAVKALFEHCKCCCVPRLRRISSRSSIERFCEDRVDFPTFASTDFRHRTVLAS
jgi:hypothetical protein